MPFRDEVMPGVRTRTHWFTAGANTFNDVAWLNGLPASLIQHCAVFNETESWADVEGAGSGEDSGDFDFTQYELMFDAAVARGLKVSFSLSHRDFTGGSVPVMPSDLVAAGHQLDVGGNTSALWYREIVWVRYVKAVWAIMNHFGTHPSFVGVRSSETALAGAPGDYSAEKAALALNHLYIAAQEQARRQNCLFIAQWNFINGANSTAESLDIWEKILLGVPRDNIIFANPDLLPDDNGISNRVFPLLHPNHSGFVHPMNRYFRMGMMSPPTYQAANPGRASFNDMDDLWLYGREVLEYDCFMWSPFDTVAFTFDTPNPDFSDAEGVMKRGWFHAYNSRYTEDI